MSDLMHRSSFRYAVTHQIDPNDVVDVLVSLGFEGGTDGFYLTELESWNEVIAQVDTDEVEFSLYWPGSSVTSKYYEYLVAFGRLLERVKFEIFKVQDLEPDPPGREVPSNSASVTHLSSFRYAVTHQSNPQEVGDGLVSLGFATGPDGFFVTEVDSWNDMVAQVKRDEVEFSLYWPGSTVTRNYYEYLVGCGRLLEQVKQFLIELPVLELPEMELSDDE